MLTKTFFYTTSLLFFLTESFGQTPVAERNSRIDLHITGDYVYFESLPTKTAFGLLGEFHFSDKLSAFFPLAIGPKYVHFGLGTLFAPLGLLALHVNDGEDQSLGEFFGMLLALATAAESMGYHVRIATGAEIIPYYSLLKFRVYRDEGYASGSAGMMLRYHHSPRWHINAYAEYSRFYASPHQNGVQTGLTLSYAFK